MKKILVATDLDGTMMPTVDMIPQNNADALRRVAQSGNMVLIATARPYGMIKHVYDTVCPGMPVCCLNGAVVLDGNGKALLTYEIDAETIFSIINETKKLDKLSNVVIEHGDLFYSVKVPRNPYMKEQMRRVGRIPLDLAAVPYTPASRLMLYTKDVNTAKILYEIAKNHTSDNYCVRERITSLTDGSLAYRYEIAHSFATKWNTVKYIADLYGISHSDIWCFGDEWNDFEMLHNSSHGYAIKGSKAEEHSKFVTSDPANIIIHEILGE